MLLNELSSDADSDNALRKSAKTTLERLRKALPKNQAGWLSVTGQDDSGALSLEED
ncbi:MAG: hypothetical protein JW904_07110 [Spirochaetales bacterium]|nr:hypothetical protein [Spirochaetales bacterium]